MRSKKQNKKAQVTIFIILGLLILSAMFIIIFIKMKSQGTKVQNDFTQAIESRPEFSKPVASFVDDCLKETLKNGLVILGERGGYIYTDKMPITIIDKNFVNSDGITLYGNDIPYWYYVKSKTNSVASPVLNTYRPYLCKYGRTCNAQFTSPSQSKDYMSIEYQLERYVGENVFSCLNNFSAFTSQGFEVTNKSAIDVSVEVRENSQDTPGVGDILVQAKYSLDITNKDQTSNVEYFQSTYNLDLYHLYSNMFTLVSTESKYGFLEQHLIILLNIYRDVGILPPTYKEDFHLQQQTWDIKKQIIPLINDIIAYAVPLIQIRDVKNFNLGTVPDKYGNPSDTSSYYGNPVQYLITQDMYDVYNGTALPDTSIYFQFFKDKFDTFVWMGPDDDWNRNGKIQEQNKYGDYFKDVDWLKDIMNLVPFYYVSSKYYISYPLLVTFVQDHAMEDGSDYTFNFPLEVNLVANQPAPLVSSLSFSGSSSENIFCDDRLRTAKVNLTILDTFTGTPVSNAKITFFCADSSCEIGQTDSNGQLNERFPGCTSGGYVEINQNNYLLSRREFFVNNGDEKTATFEIDPIIYQNYTIKKIKFSDVLKYNSSVFLRKDLQHDLTENDSVTLSFIRNSNNFSEGDYSFTAMPDKGSYVNAPYLKLIQGNYSMTAMLMAYHNIYIPSEFERAGNESDARCTKIGKTSEKVFMDAGPHPLGGAKLNFATNNHYICMGEPDGIFYSPNWRDLWHLLGISDDTFIGQYTQRKDCNNFVNDYFSKSLPVFQETTVEVENPGSVFIINTTGAIISEDDFDTFINTPKKTISFESETASQIENKLKNLDGVTQSQIDKIKEKVNVANITQVYLMQGNTLSMIVNDMNNPTLFVNSLGKNISLDDYTNGFKTEVNFVLLSKTDSDDVSLSKISASSGISQIQIDTFNSNFSVENVSKVSVLTTGNLMVVLRDPNIQNNTVAIQNGTLDLQQVIKKAIATCSPIISDSMKDCSQSNSCGSDIYQDNSHTFVKDTYYSCMNFKYMFCLMHDHSDSWIQYGQCIFDNKFCNKDVRWYGDDLSQDKILPIYQMSDREYDACNLRSGYFNVGLDLRINKDSDSHIQSQKDIDQFASITTDSKYIYHLNGQTYKEFGGCPAGFADIFNNTNMTSSTNTIIQPIKIINQPYLDGGLIAVEEATGVSWMYNPYLDSNSKKNVTIFVFENDFTPISYKDFNQQQNIIDLSTEYGQDAVNSFLR